MKNKNTSKPRQFFIDLQKLQTVKLISYEYMNKA